MASANLSNIKIKIGDSSINASSLTTNGDGWLIFDKTTHTLWTSGLQYGGYDSSGNKINDTYSTTVQLQTVVNSLDTSAFGNSTTYIQSIIENNGIISAMTATMPTKLSQFTDDVVNGNYLKLSGGTMTGVLQLSNSGLKFADNAFGGSGDAAKIYLTTKGGEDQTMTFEVENDGNDTINFITPSSTGLTHNSEIILDAGNYSSYALPLSGGTLSGQITSTLATGTSPFSVTSTTLNTNLNADLLDNQHGSYYTDYADTAVNNLQVGGRNLLFNSNDFSKWNLNATYSSITQDGYLKYMDNYVSNQFGPNNIVVQEDGYYTVSFTCVEATTSHIMLEFKKISGGGIGQTYIHAGKNILTYYLQADTYYGLSIFGTSTGSNYVIIKNDVKVEEGNKATAWTPAPEDVTYAISEAQQNAEDYAAPVNHASSVTTYGLGTTSLYGHTKLIDALTSSSYADGQALSAYQGYLLANGSARDSTKLPLSGGTLSGTALFSFADSGNWSNSNSGVTFPVTRGGFHWSGQSDWVKLFAEETGLDNLDLIIQFGDDNSNRLQIRNASGSETAYITATGVFGGTLSGNASSASKVNNALSWSGYSSGSFNGSAAASISIPTKLSQFTNDPGFITSLASITGSAHSLSVIDTRSSNVGPNLGNTTDGVRFDFKSNSQDGLSDGGAYHGILTFQQWRDATGGGTRQLGFTDNDNLWIRGSGSALSSYGSWKLFLNSTNYSSYALPLSGGTMSGPIRFSSGSWLSNTDGNIYTSGWGGYTGWLFDMMKNCGMWNTQVLNVNNYSSYALPLHGTADAALKLYSGASTSNNAMIFNWSGQTGQPKWLWGGNDGTNMYVYNPSNFNVAYASNSGALSGYTINNIQEGGWISLPRNGNSSSILWIKIGQFITTVNDNLNNDACVEILVNGDQNYACGATGTLIMESYGTTSRSIVLNSISADTTESMIYATIDSDFNIWLGFRAQFTGRTLIRPLFQGSYVNIFTSGFTSQSTNPNDIYISGNGSYRYGASVSINQASGLNASSATKLTTARTLWGQSFDGKGNVDGTFVLNATASNSWPATSGTTQTGLSARFKGSDNATMDFGHYGSNGTWIQSTDIGSLGTYYPLLLNPNGGNLGIGTTSPTYKLDVNGTIHASGAATLDGTLFLNSDLNFGNVESGTRGINSVVADNDGWYIQGEGSGSDNGALRLGTYDDSNEPIMVSQGGSRSSFTRTAYLLDANGNTSFPGVMKADGGFQGNLTGNVSTSNPIINSYSNNSWINGVSNACLNCDYSASGYGAIFNAPVKGGRISLSTYPYSDNHLYFGYATAAQISAGTNSLNAQIVFDMENSIVTASRFVGNVSGSASSLSVNAGSASQPVYFSGGVPVATSYAFGNGSGNVPISNGILNTNLNANLLNGYTTTEVGANPIGSIPIVSSSGTFDIGYKLDFHEEATSTIFSYIRSLDGDLIPSGNIVPEGNNLFNLGSHSFSFKTLFVENIDTTGLKFFGWWRTDGTYMLRSSCSLGHVSAILHNSTGNFTINHNLGTPYYTVVITEETLNNDYNTIQVRDKQSNSFGINIRETGGHWIDSGFEFAVFS